MDGKERAAFFSQAEQELIMHAYEDYKGIITKKGNTSCLIKAREAAWQKIADRLNESNISGMKRSWQQVKIKYKNILQNATKKKAAAAAAGGGPPPEPCTPAEVMALAQNSARHRPVIEGIKGGTSSEVVPSIHVQAYVKVVDGVITLLDPEPKTIESLIAGTSTTQGDEERISVHTGRLAECEEQGEQSSQPSSARPSSARTTATQRPSNAETDIRSIYKRYLLQEIEVRKAECDYKQLKIKKLKYEIMKLDRDEKK